MRGLTVYLTKERGVVLKKSIRALSSNSSLSFLSNYTFYLHVGMAIMLNVLATFHSIARSHAISHTD